MGPKNKNENFFELHKYCVLCLTDRNDDNYFKQECLWKKAKKKAIKNIF